MQVEVGVHSEYAGGVPLIGLAIVIVLAFIALIPVSIVLRFRAGTIRRRAIGWIITLNFVGTLLSVLLFLLAAAVSTNWVPGTLTYTAAGLAIGNLLGIAGLALTRWEVVSGRLHYTPNRWLVLLITLVVTARVGYGFYRSWEAWQATLDRMAWVAASGVATSMSAGAVVLGYYLVYWAGVRRRQRRLAVSGGRPWI
jgi:RsiW-degrading membrane proteinase PrsW (M82 family)